MRQTEMLLNARPAGIITAKPANNHCLLWRLMGEVETNQGYKARRLEMAGLVDAVPTNVPIYVFKEADLCAGSVTLTALEINQDMIQLSTEIGSQLIPMAPKSYGQYTNMVIINRSPTASMVATGDMATWATPSRLYSRKPIDLEAIFKRGEILDAWQFRLA